jgi:hypothetical protein
VKEQEAVQGCFGCSTHKAVRNYSQIRFAALAREAAGQLEQMEATGLYGGYFKHRTLWDEYCHEVQTREDGSREIPCRASFGSAMFAVIETISGSEAELLNIGAKWHVDEGQNDSANMVGIIDPVLCNLQDALETLAIRRDMTEFDAPAEGRPWPIRVEDVAPLERLGDAVRLLSPLAKRGNDLIAVGEACGAIEKILSSEIVNVNVGLTVGFRQGNPDVFEEGRFASIRINAREIILDQMDSTYSAGFGSDHYTTACASLEPEGVFDESGVAEWISRVDWLRSEEGATLTVERDHI